MCSKLTKFVRLENLTSNTDNWGCAFSHMSRVECCSTIHIERNMLRRTFSSFTFHTHNNTIPTHSIRLLSYNTVLRREQPPKGSPQEAKKRPPFDTERVFRLTEPPNPDWQYGESYLGSIGADEWAKDEGQGWKSLDTSQMTPRYLAIH